MKKILTSTLMIIIASAVFAGFVLAESTKGTVNASELNFRESANTSANAIDVLYKGARVNIISEQGDWYKVKYNNEEGYVSKQYITRDNATDNTTNTNTNETNTASSNEAKNETNTSTNTTTPSNNDNNTPVDFDKINVTKIKDETTMYVLPLINSTKLGKINANTNVLLISVNGDWAYIQTENKNGWVFTKTLEKTSITLGTPNTNNNGNSNNNDNNTTNENTTTSANTVENTTTNEVNTTSEPTATPTPEPTATTTTTSSEYPTTMYVNVEAVNVRSQANTTSTVVTSVGKNVPITVEAKEGDWYKVKTSDGNGYIKADYLSKTK